MRKELNISLCYFECSPGNDSNKQTFQIYNRLIINLNQKFRKKSLLEAVDDITKSYKSNSNIKTNSHFLLQFLIVNKQSVGVDTTEYIISEIQ